MRQSQSELFWALHREHAASVVGSKNLPRDFAQPQKGIPRLSLALGVQVDDPAIRQRLFTQLTISQLPLIGDQQRAAPVALPDADAEAEASADSEGDSAVEPPAEDEERMVVKGLAVNKRLDADEAAVFSWLGFAVVKNEMANKFTPGLTHYASHVRALGLSGENRPLATCTLKDPVRP
jgi:flagellar basal body rod protein FlgF